MSFSAQEIEEFKVEATELLDVAEKSLLELDKDGDFKDCFDSVFRGFHNLKGAAGMMEFTALQAHTHELESIWMSFKDKQSIPKNYVTFFCRGIDASRLLLAGEMVTFDYHIEDAEAATSEVYKPIELLKEKSSLADELPESAIDEFLVECDEILDIVSSKLQLMEKGVFDKSVLDDLYRNVHSLKGSAYLFSFNNLGDIAHAMESSLEKVRNGTHSPSSQLLNFLFKSLEVVEAMLKRMKARESDEAFIPVIQVIVKALHKASEFLIETEAKTSVQIDEPSSSLPPEARVNEDAILTMPAPQVHGSKEKEPEGLGSIRVPVSLLDSLMTLMGEMVLVRNQVLQYSNKTDDLEFLSMSKRLNVVTSEIQGEMMKTRMQPIGNVLEKFNRVVRDLSHDLKKNIHLVIHGSDTELDKSLLEAIKDPLTHIVRNSCDHGIETPEIRRQSGKPEAGSVTIKSYHEGGQVVIEVSDDGKGLHKEQLLKKGLEKGLITSAQAELLSDKEIFDLIFAPGFSTAAQVTNVSGRGVGMDVVRTNIEKIGGSVELSGRAGFGTTIKIKIPLTLAIVPALIVKCGTGTFAIPQVKLEELVRVDQHSSSKIEILHGAPVYRLRGNILPLVDLNKLLGISGSSYTNYVDASINIAVLNAENITFGILVDEIQDTADIVVKPLNKLLRSLQVYSGATILGDGSISLIFDVTGISKVAQLSQVRSRVKEEESNKMSEIQEFLVFKLGSATNHALALNYVQRLEEFKFSDVETSGDQRVIRYRDKILPLISANVQLGYPDSEKASDTFPVVVIEKSGHFYGVVVDEILDTMSTTLEVKDPIKNHRGIFGNINMPDRLVVVVDPFELISMALNEQAELVAKPRDIEIGSRADHKVVRILLVEDTVFFRKAIKSVLDKRGYEVILAQDGIEAIEILNKKEFKIDLIVSDIEMPRMNGFQMAAAIRKNPTYTNIPMLAISSKADKQYRQEGMKAGFDIYLEKLKPEVLLAAVAELQRNNKVAA